MEEFSHLDTAKSFRLNQDAMTETIESFPVVEKVKPAPIIEVK